MYEVELSCKHTLGFKSNPPRIGETVHCRRCPGERHVSNRANLWTVDCQHCPYKRTIGIDKDYTKKKARQHSARKQGHVCVIYLDKDPIDSREEVLPITQKDHEPIPY